MSGNTGGDGPQQQQQQQTTKVYSELVPKSETQVDAFLQNHPTFDGRNVIVAIFDTGFDPNAAGLNDRTSDGKQKVIDVIDGTGSGDIDTSKTVTMSLADCKTDAEAVLTGLSGRQLQLNRTWKNPTGIWHLGIKAAYDLFPNDLSKKVSEARGDQRKAEHEQNTAVLNQLQSELQLQYEECKDPAAKEALNVKKKDMEELSSVYGWANGNVKDVGPVYDCVCFHDGSVWRVVLDINEDGDLRERTLMTDFRVEYQFEPFSGVDLMNYSVNIYENGNCVSIVTTAGSHGSHVAGIVGGCYSDRPELNGIAPGTQLISVKIGESRLGSMETAPGLIRGMLHVKNAPYKVDLINLSYGEASTEPNVGVICQLAKDLVFRSDIMFIASAGNAGPAYSSVGSPGGTTEGLISVGAYVSEGMMHSMYSMHQANEGQNFTWSSRGPCHDGALGVSIIACGGAIASVPNYQLKRNQLMNGTSMSSPAACGGIALLLSSLKQSNMRYSPAWVRRAVENSALLVPRMSRLEQGHGLLQVASAWDWLVDNKADNLDYPDLGFRVRVDGWKRGVYLRDRATLDAASDFSVTVAPRWKNHRDVDQENPLTACTMEELNRRKVAFAIDVDLQVHYITRCDQSIEELKRSDSKRANAVLELTPAEKKANGTWVRCADYVQLAADGRTISVTVDPTALELSPGLHYAEIWGMDRSTPNASNPLFRVPVTVLRPDLLPASPTQRYEVCKNATMTRGTILRRYVMVPTGASFAKIQIGVDNCQPTQLAKFMFHAMQVRSHESHPQSCSKSFFSLSSGRLEGQTFEVVVEGDTVLELCLASYWSAQVTCDASISVSFGGLALDQQRLCVDLDRITRFSVTSLLQDESCKPSVSWKTLQRTLTPSCYSLVPLGRDRDLEYDGEVIYQLILTYTFHLPKAGKVTPRTPLINGTLYECAIGGQLWLCYDANKKRVGCGDAWPDAIKLDQKGTYTLRLEIRDVRKSVLESLTHTTMVVEQTCTDLKTQIYSSRGDALLNKSAVGSTLLVKGAKKVYFAAPPSLATLVKAELKLGDRLRGEIVLENSGSKQSAGQRPKGFPVVAYLAFDPKKADGVKRKDFLAGRAATSTTTTTTTTATATEQPQPDSNDAKQTKDEEQDDTKAKQQQPATEDNKNNDKDDNDALEVRERVRDKQLKLLRDSVKNEKEFELLLAALLPNLSSEWPSHLPVAFLPLLALATKKDPDWPNVLNSAKQLLATIDMNELKVAAFDRWNKDDPHSGQKSKDERKEWNKRKTRLVETQQVLVETLVLVCQSCVEIDTKQSSPEVLSDLKSNLEALSSFVKRCEIKLSAEDKKKLCAADRHVAQREQRLGAVLAMLKKSIQSSDTSDADKRKLVMQAGKTLEQAASELGRGVSFSELLRLHKLQDILDFPKGNFELH